MTTLIFTPKEIHILTQIISIVINDEQYAEQLRQFVKSSEISNIRNKLQNVKG